MACRSRTLSGSFILWHQVPMIGIANQEGHLVSIQLSLFLEVMSLLSLFSYSLSSCHFFSNCAWPFTYSCCVCREMSSWSREVKSDLYCATRSLISSVLHLVSSCSQSRLSSGVTFLKEGKSCILRPIGQILSCIYCWKNYVPFVCTLLRPSQVMQNSRRTPDWDVHITLLTQPYITASLPDGRPFMDFSAFHLYIYFDKVFAYYLLSAYFSYWDSLLTYQW